MVFYTNRAVYSYMLGIWQSDICKQVVFWNKLTANGLLTPSFTHLFTLQTASFSCIRRTNALFVPT